MRNRFLLALLGTLLLATPASATTVQYGTAGVFSGCTDVTNHVFGCTANGNQIQFGTDLGSNVGIVLTYIGIAGSTIVTTPTNASFGEVVFACLDGGTGCASRPIPAGLVLTINVSQTLPTAGGPTGIPSGSVVGTVSGTSNTGEITWPVSNAITIDAISYRIASSPLSLVPPSTSNGSATVQGVISEVPEPSTLGEVGLGMIGLGLVRHRLRSRVRRGQAPRNS